MGPKTENLHFTRLSMVISEDQDNFSTWPSPFFMLAYLEGFVSEFNSNQQKPIANPISFPMFHWFSGWWFGTFFMFPFSWEFHHPN